MGSVSMSLTVEDKVLVQSSFKLVATIADQAAELFYNRLFEIAPEVKPLFGEVDMAEQGRKLMKMIATAVGALNDLDKVIPAVQEMGKRHVAYGVEKEHYAIVGEALLWTLAQGLGEVFTPETEAAWTKVYTLLAEVATSEAYAEPAR